MNIASCKSIRSIKAKRVLLLAFPAHPKLFLGNLGLHNKHASPELLMELVQHALKEIGGRVKIIILCDNKYYFRKYKNVERNGTSSITLCEEIHQLICEELFFISPFLNWVIHETIQHALRNKTTTVTGFSYVHGTRFDKIMDISLFSEIWKRTSSLSGALSSLYSTREVSEFNHVEFLLSFLSNMKQIYRSGLQLRCGSADTLHQLFSSAQLPHVRSIDISSLGDYRNIQPAPGIKHVLLLNSDRVSKHVSLEASVLSIKSLFINAHIILLSGYGTSPLHEAQNFWAADLDNIIDGLKLRVGCLLAYIRCFSAYTEQLNYTYDMDSEFEHHLASIDVLAIEKFYNNIKPYCYSNAIFYSDLWYDIYSNLSHHTTIRPFSSDDETKHESRVAKLTNTARSHLAFMIIHKTHTQETFLLKVKEFILNHYETFKGDGKVEKLRKALILFEYPDDLIDDLDPDPKGSKWRKGKLEGTWRQKNVKITEADLIKAKLVETTPLGSLQWVVDNIPKS
jgi:hypothetical protein